MLSTTKRFDNELHTIYLFLEEEGGQVTVELAELFAVELAQAWTAPEDAVLVASALRAGIPVQIKLP